MSLWMIFRPTDEKSFVFLLMRMHGKNEYWRTFFMTITLAQNVIVIKESSKYSYSHLLQRIVC